MAKSRSITEEESKALLKHIMKDFGEDIGITWEDHKPIPAHEDTYRITCDKLSLPALIHLMDQKNVKNVYFHPVVAPGVPGRSAIAMRYRLFVQYKKVKSTK